MPGINMHWDNEEIRDRVLTPQKMGFLADQLEEAIRTMLEWGIRIPPDSRLPGIIRLLRDVASLESFPESSNQRAKIAQAARDAQEFTEIGWVLPSEKLRPLRERLQQAVFGSLEGARDHARQAQSELWTGAMLARSGTFTGVRVAAQGKNPDFVLNNGNVEYAVEVKRPTNPERARDRVSDAAGQLRQHKYHGGAIVVDLTDCLSPDLASRSGRGPPCMDPVEARVKELTNSLREVVFDDSSQRIRPRMRHVFALVTFVRTIWWNLDDLSRMHPLRYVLTIPFHGRGKTLRYWRARWLAELIAKGIWETGHQDLGCEDVTFDHWIRQDNDSR